MAPISRMYKTFHSLPSRAKGKMEASCLILGVWKVSSACYLCADGSTLSGMPIIFVVNMGAETEIGQAQLSV